MRAVHTGQTELLPTASNTLLIEAGCSAEKTRKLIKWLKEKLAIAPDMPVLFLTTRKTHADELAATLARAGLMGFKNYLDDKSTDKSKTEYLSDATRCIVSLQSISKVDIELYAKGVVVMDEVRSLAAIPGGGTLDDTTRLPQSLNALEALCSGAEYRIAMDADVSADGAVRDWLRLVAPRFNVLHVQLRKAALKREVHMGFGTASKKSAQIMKKRVKLALHHARRSRAEAIEGEAGEQLRAVALAVIGSLVRVVRGGAGDYALPRRKDGGARDAPVEWRAVSWGLARRAPRSAATRIDVTSAFADARSGVCRLIQRVFVITSRPKPGGRCRGDGRRDRGARASGRGQVLWQGLRRHEARALQGHDEGVVLGGRRHRHLDSERRRQRAHSLRLRLPLHVPGRGRRAAARAVSGHRARGARRR